MFYNINTNQLLNSCPQNGYLPIIDDGSENIRYVLVQGLDHADFETQKACGILPVKSDTPVQPENSYEDISQRSILIEEDGIILTRVYLSNPIIVPENISARQVRLWLLQNGIGLNQVEDAINTINDPLLRESTRVEWEYAPYIERNHALIESLGQFLGLTPEQIDQGFITASTL